MNERIDDDLIVLHKVVQHVSLRQMHLLIYQLYMTLAVGSMAGAVNFFFSHPTFNPGGADKRVIAAVFLVLGVSELILLTIYHRLFLLKVVVGSSMGFMLAWGLANTQQFWDGNASLQMPIYLFTLAACRFFLLRAPIINPLTANGNGNGKKLNGKP